MWRSLLVAVFFGLHPLRVESVAWIAERKDVLSGCLGLLSLILYVRYARKVSSGQVPQTRPTRALNSAPATLNYSLALLFLALGLMSKAMLVTWPFVMLLLDYWPLERFKSAGAWRLVREKTPFFCLAALASVVTFAVQKHEGAVAAQESLTFGWRSGNALVSDCRYLGKIFWPTDLAVIYPHPGEWPLLRVLLAGILMGAILVLVWVKRERYPFLLMGWLWYCGTLVPVIGLVQVGSHAMADRYTYLPSVGVLICAVWGAAELARHRSYLATPLLAGTAGGILLCVELTRHQLGYWQESETLFRQALKVTTENPVASNNLGDALVRKGRIDEAIGHFQQALRLMPDFDDAHNSLGNALARKGQLGEAILQFEEAVRLRPDRAVPHYNLGMVLAVKGKFDEAVRNYREAVRLNTD
jgi:hypothetical protein